MTQFDAEKELPEDHYMDSVRIRGEGMEICCGGHFIAMPIREWHRIAKEFSLAHSQGRAEGIEECSIEADRVKSHEMGMSSGRVLHCYYADVATAIRSMLKEEK